MVESSIEIISFQNQPSMNESHYTQISLASHHDDNLDLDTYYKEMSDRCDYLTLQDDVVNGRDDRQDVLTIRKLPEKMKSTLFYGKQEMLECSQEKLKARHPFEEEAKKFPKVMDNVLKRGDQSESRINLAKTLLEQSNNALAIAKAGQSSMYTANVLFKQMIPVFDESCKLNAQKIVMDVKALDLLREADLKSRQRQVKLQECKIEEADVLLQSAMDCIEMSVSTAEQHMIQSQELYLRYCEDKTISKLKHLEKDIHQTVEQEYNDLKTIHKHSEDDILRSNKAFETLEQVYQDSIIHHRKMDEDLSSKLSHNKTKQEALKEELRALNEEAIVIDTQRTNAERQQRTAGKEYQNSRGIIEHWLGYINHLEGQSLYALQVLDIAKQCSDIVLTDYYTTHNQHLDNLNQLSCDTLIAFRKTLSIRIVACRLRIEELDSNITQIEESLRPIKEELKGFTRTGLKIMADDRQSKVLEFSTVKTNYKNQYNKAITLLEQAQTQMAKVEAIIKEKFKDVILESVDQLFEERKSEINEQWETIQLDSLTLQFN